jgi:hypothetical protein
VNTCGLTSSLRSNTSRTTLGRFWATRTLLMYGSFDSILATRLLSVSLSARPSMSTTSRGGLGTIKCVALRLLSFSSVTRV